jgi:hypothetical protein
MIWRMLFGAQPVNATTMLYFRRLLVETAMPNTAITKVDLLANVQEARIGNSSTAHLPSKLITY